MTDYWNDWFAPKMIYFTLLGLAYLVPGVYFVPPLAKALSESMPNVWGWNIILAMPFAMHHYIIAASLAGEFVRKSKKGGNK